ncbi:hypothetical protein, partial [Vibrio vulnificus]
LPYELHETKPNCLSELFADRPELCRSVGIMPIGKISSLHSYPDFNTTRNTQKQSFTVQNGAYNH